MITMTTVTAMTTVPAVRRVDGHAGTGVVVFYMLIVMRVPVLVMDMTARGGAGCRRRFVHRSSSRFGFAVHQHHEVYTP